MTDEARVCWCRVDHPWAPALCPALLRHQLEVAGRSDEDVARLGEAAGEVFAIYAATGNWRMADNWAWMGLSVNDPKEQ
jgi:hypothetical protein